MTAFSATVMLSTGLPPSTYLGAICAAHNRNMSTILYPCSARAARVLYGSNTFARFPAVAFRYMAKGLKPVAYGTTNATTKKMGIAYRSTV